MVLDADNEGTGLEVNDAEEEEEDSTDVEKLQKILDDEEDSPISRRQAADEKCMSLTAAALALATEEAVVM